MVQKSDRYTGKCHDSLTGSGASFSGHVRLVNAAQSTVRSIFCGLRSNKVFIRHCAGRSKSRHALADGSPWARFPGPVSPVPSVVPSSLDHRRNDSSRLSNTTQDQDASKMGRCEVCI